MARPLKTTEPREVQTEAPEDAYLTRTQRIAELAAEHKALDLRALDVRGLTLLADSFVLCSAGSEPQMRAIINAIKEGLKEQGGVRPSHTEGTYADGWVVLDYGAVIVHIFREEARRYYALDDLWGDAPILELNLAD